MKLIKSTKLTKEPKKKQTAGLFRDPSSPLAELVNELIGGKTQPRKKAAKRQTGSAISKAKKELNDCRYDGPEALGPPARN